MDRETLTIYLRELYLNKASALGIGNQLGADRLGAEIAVVEERINKIPVLIAERDTEAERAMERIDRALKIERRCLWWGVVVLAAIIASWILVEWRAL